MKPEIQAIIPTLRKFIGKQQLQVMLDGLKGEEASYFEETLLAVNKVVTSAPTTYQTDGQGDAAIVQLHYFGGTWDWYITELDQEEEQLQAFGLVKANGEHAELGYISIIELLENGIELDLFFTPKALNQIGAN